MVSERIANPSYRLFGSTSSILVPSARASLEPGTNPNTVLRTLATTPVN